MRYCKDLELDTFLKDCILSELIHEEIETQNKNRISSRTLHKGKSLGPVYFVGDWEEILRFSRRHEFSTPFGKYQGVCCWSIFL